MRKEIFEHFKNIAPIYDNFKRKNYYYYSILKKLYKYLIPLSNEKTVLEIGTGTGEIIDSIDPKFGVGIDPIYEMLKIAKKKFENKKNLFFIIGEAESLPIKYNFDYIILPDVLEHLHNPEKAISQINLIASDNTVVIISWANSLWKPILDLLEKLNLKMPEGPHNWLPFSELKKLLLKYKFKIVKNGTRCLIPIYIPFFSGFINRTFDKIPFIRNLGLIRFIVIKK